MIIFGTRVTEKVGN